MQQSTIHTKDIESALAADRAYTEDGLHITDDELFDWLDKWGSSDEPEAPNCHS